MTSSNDVVEQGYREREAVVQAFFEAESERLAELCHRMARRFARGGRLIAFGLGPAATDAQHVSVEFVHPVIVGKRALPALALVNDAASTLALAVGDHTGFFARELSLVGRSEDIALGMVHGADDVGTDAVAAGLKQATALGMLSISLAGAHSGPVRDGADYAFEVASSDPFIVQEVHETLYHVLWKLVHVFFEHKGLLEDRVASRTHDTGRSSFLYPFLAEAESNVETVLHDVRASIVKKATDVTDMRAASKDAGGLAQTAAAVRERVDASGKLVVFGNGGSATDAQDLVTDLMVPPPSLPSIAAISLTNDAAVMTGVGNDVGFDNVFARQMIPYADENDVAVAISTSGGSRNVITAVDEARRRGLLTVALAGYGGGRLAETCERVHVIDGDYIPRIQEAQATQYHLLRRLLS